MSPPAADGSLTSALDRAVVGHFVGDGLAVAEGMLAAGCTVVASIIAGARDSVARCVRLDWAQPRLGCMVAEVVKGDAAHSRKGPR